MKYDPKTVRKFSESLAAGNKQGLSLPLVDKDVWITYMLREIYALPEGKHLAFKGGTCLVKAYYGYYRFSEDVDLTWVGGKIKEHDFRRNVVEQVMDSLGLEWYKDEKVKTGIAGTQSGKVMNYFFLSPEPKAQSSKLKMTVAFKETLKFPLEEIRLKTVTSNKRRLELQALYGDAAKDYFDSATAQCYSIREIACEKIRAILTRKAQLVRSRDIVDLYHISGRLGGLEKAAPPSAAKTKLSSVLSIPAYAKEYSRTTANLHEHLQQLARQSGQDPVFIKRPELTKLSAFAEELEEYISKNVLVTAVGKQRI